MTMGAVSDKEKGLPIRSPFFPRNVQMELEQCPNAGILSGSVSFVEARRIPSAAPDGILLSPAGIPYETRLL